MKKRIQLKESDIKRMVMEALSELTAQNAFDASDLAKQKAIDAMNSDDLDLVQKKLNQSKNFMNLGWDKERHPDRPVVHAPKDFKWSQDNNPTRVNKDPKRESLIFKLCKQHPTIPDMLDAWIESVNRQEAEKMFNDSIFNDDNQNYSIEEPQEDTENMDDYIDTIQKTARLRRHDREVEYAKGKYKDIQTPEYWALQALCSNSFNKRTIDNNIEKEPLGFLNMGDVYKIAKLLFYDLDKTDEDGQKVSKEKIDKSLPKIVENLEIIVSEAFNSGKIARFFPKIKQGTNSEHRFSIFKYNIIQDGAQYLRSVLRDYFFRGVDVSIDGGGGEDDSVSLHVPDGLKSDMFGNVDGRGPYAAKKALKDIKDIMKFVLNDKYNSDINSFYSNKDKNGRLQSHKSMVYALRYIVDNFNNIFNSRTIDTFTDLISKEKTTVANGTETIYNESTEQGMIFIKDVVAQFIAKHYYEGYNNTPDNVHIERKKAKNFDANGNRPYENRIVTTCGDVILDKLLNPMFEKNDEKAKEDGRPNDVYIQVNGNKAVMNRPYEDVVAKVKGLLEPMWTTLGQGGEFGRGATILSRYRYNQNNPPLSNPGAVNEKLIRKIVMETLRRHLRML